MPVTELRDAVNIPRFAPIARRLVTEFPYFAKRCLKIRPKEGGLIRFQLNAVQQVVHERLEEQRRATGRVRALVLKARQPGICLAPSMRVLTSDLRWIALSEMRIGERLVAVDENIPGGKGPSRKMRTCVVEAIASVTRPAFELTLDSGVKLIASGEHRFLCQQRGGDYCQWRAVDCTKPGDHIRHITEPWSEPTLEDAWFGGLLDGEGALRPKSRAGVECGVWQVDGPVLERAKAYLSGRGYTFREDIDRRDHRAEKPVHSLVMGRIAELFRLIGQTRPTRFVGVEWWDDKCLPGKRIGTGWSQVIAIKPLGEMTLVDLQTSHKTFICEGVVSHNSTYVEGRFFHQVMNRAGVQAYVLTHMQDATDNVFEFTRRFYDNLPDAIKPVTKAANAKELRFASLDSGVEVSTAGARGAGRSYTIQLFHGSEVAFWQNAPEHMAGVMQAVPNAVDTEVILESTANGVGGLFYDMCQDAQTGESEYQLIFVPWFSHVEYRERPPRDWRPNEEFMDYAAAWQLDPDQLYWMWRTNHSMAVAHNRDPEQIAWVFRQEYPASVAEAFQIADFDAFIRPELVVRARKATIPDQSDFPLILGVDTAHGGDAKTHIVERRGRVAGHLVDESLDTSNTMEIVGRIARLIDMHRPDAVFIDTTNNPAIYDRLRELGHKQVQAVSFGTGAHRSDRYQNKRVEMADDLAKWLEEGADIPDSDEWQADLCATGIALPDSLGRMKLEQKEAVIKRTRRTLDRFDALITTFAEPVRIPAPRTVRVLPKQANSAYRPTRWR